MSHKIDELEPVVLMRDLPKVRLRRGDVGAVVHRYEAGPYDVEFVTGGGETVGSCSTRSAS